MWTSDYSNRCPEIVNNISVKSNIFNYNFDKRLRGDDAYQQDSWLAFLKVCLSACLSHYLNLYFPEIDGIVQTNMLKASWIADAMRSTAEKDE
jgi:hypothetical protein